VSSSFATFLEESPAAAEPAPERTSLRAESAGRSARALRARYDVAQTTDDNIRHWANADFWGPKSALSPWVRRRLRSRSRYEVENNTYAAGMIRTLALDTIGTGPSLQMLSGAQADDSQVERSFGAWSTAVRLPLKLRTMRGAKAVDGETFASFFTNRPLPNPVKLDIQPHEAEQIADPAQGILQNSLSDGILFDDYGNLAAYILLKHHPGEALFLGTTLQYDTVRARDMLHVFNCERAGQVRGVPEISSALPLFAQLRRFTLAVLAAAESAADVAAFIETQQASLDPEEIEPLEEIDFVKRMMLTLPRGWKMSQLHAEQPATTYQMFKRELIAEIARCLSMPYNVAAGDSSGYNYSSGRLDHKTYFKGIRVERSLWELLVLDVILARWWEEARLIGGLLPDALRGLSAPPAHAWRWDGDESVDPLKESMADTEGLNNFSTTLDEICGRDGRDYEAVLRQRAKELELMRELKMPIAVPGSTPTKLAQQGTDAAGDASSSGQAAWAPQNAITSRNALVASLVADHQPSGGLAV
jgi:lambda family phage portal protein